MEVEKADVSVLEIDVRHLAWGRMVTYLYLESSALLEGSGIDDAYALVIRKAYAVDVA